MFVDVSLPTYNIDPRLIEAAVSQRTRAIMIAHTLGNPFDLDAVMDLARRHDLWVVEDCCDALGSTYRDRKVGTFGHIGTLSFYPAHHITMGEGGAVFTDDDLLRRASNRCGIGGGTATAPRDARTPAESASNGSWAICRPATITSTRILIWDTT